MESEAGLYVMFDTPLHAPGSGAHKNAAVAVLRRPVAGKPILKKAAMKSAEAKRPYFSALKCCENTASALSLALTSISPSPLAR